MSDWMREIERVLALALGLALLGWGSPWRFPIQSVERSQIRSQEAIGRERVVHSTQVSNPLLKNP